MIIRPGNSKASAPKRSSTALIDDVKRFAEWAHSMAEMFSTKGWSPQEHNPVKFSEQLTSIKQQWSRVQGGLQDINGGNSKRQKITSLLDALESILRQPAENRKHVSANVLSHLSELSQCVALAMDLLPPERDPVVTAPADVEPDLLPVNGKEQGPPDQIVVATGKGNLAINSTSTD